MKKVLLFILNIIFVISLSAQSNGSFAIYDTNWEDMTGDTVTFTHALDTLNPIPYYEHKNFINVVNESNDSIVIDVIRIEHAYISGSEDYYCWKSCYNAVPAGSRTEWRSPESVVLAAGDTVGAAENLAVYLKTNNNTGVAVYEYRFTDPDDALGINDRSIFIKYNISYLTSLHKNIAEETAFNLYPNPAQNIVALDFEKRPEQNLSIEIKDILGKQVQTLSVEASAQNIQFDVSSYPKGIYFVSVLDRQQILKTKKLIVK